MNTLTLIKKQIQKAAALHDAQISHTAYRGVEYDQRNVESKESSRHILLSWSYIQQVRYVC